MIELRAYQIDVITEFERQRANGKRRILMVAPTASGKTVIVAAITKHALQNYQDVLALAHRREIIKQTSSKLLANGVHHGIIQAGFNPSPLERVQVASVQTLSARAMRSDKIHLPPADLLWIDEAHHCPARTYQKIIDAYPDATLLGLTATPCRGDGRGLGGIFEVLIETPQVPELIKLGYLVPTRVYAPPAPDLSGIRIQAGDYNEQQLADRMDRPQLVGDIVQHWLKYGARRQTVAFAVSVGHSIHLRDEFLAAGVRAEQIDGSTPKDERDATLARLASGEIEIVSNCMVLTEGWDMPEVGCCILARPTRKMGLYRQMVGRVLRPAPDKKDAIILDHAGAVHRHGFAEDPVEWTLDPDRRATSEKHTKRGERGSRSRLIECVQCGAVRVTGEPCFNCGYLPARERQSVEVIDGDLGLVDRKRRVHLDLNDPNVRHEWHGMLAYIAAERGYKAGWIAHKFKERFGVFPPWGSSPVPIPPTLEVRRWVKSRAIAWAKAQEASA